MTTREYWIMHPEFFRRHENERAMVPVIVEPNPYHDYESDPEYYKISLPELDCGD